MDLQLDKRIEGEDERDEKRKKKKLRSRKVTAKQSSVYFKESWV
jgi:hypothetical protein